jgi:hypothetical protein
MENKAFNQAALQYASEGHFALQNVHLIDIPVQKIEYRLHLIGKACRSATDVTLIFDASRTPFLSQMHDSEVQWEPVAQLGETLSPNSFLTSLRLSLIDNPKHVFNLDCLLGAITRLKRLSIASFSESRFSDRARPRCVPPCIGKMHCLTHLRLGPDFHLMDIPELLPHMEHLRSLHLLDSYSNRRMMPALGSLTKLQRLQIEGFQRPKLMPCLAPLTALQTLELVYCSRLQQLPSLDRLAALQVLKLQRCSKLQHLPYLDSLSPLKELSLVACHQLLQLPPLDSLTALKTLDVSACIHLQQLPPLNNLTALQWLHIRYCEKLRRGCLKLPSTHEPKLIVHGVTEEKMHDLQGKHNEKRIT